MGRINPSVYPNNTILICWLLFKNRPSKTIYKKMKKVYMQNFKIKPVGRIIFFDFVKIHDFRFLNIPTTLAISNSRFKQ